MKKSEISVLIVDDEDSIRASLEKAIKKAGFNPLTAGKADEALNVGRIKPIHAAVIDCLLPGMNGVELAKELRKGALQEGPIMFVSGIYRDKAFADDAMKKAAALDFFQKPFEAQDIINALEDSLQSMVDAPKVALHSLLSKPFSSTRERKKAFDHIEEISGSDLTLALSILLESESSGHLNLADDSGEIFGITLAKGIINNVDTSEAFVNQSSLLMEKGLISSEDLESVQGKKGDLIQQLVDKSLISPHTEMLIKKELIFKNLNFICDQNNLKVNFVRDRKIKPQESGVSIEEFTEEAHKIIDSKITLEWFQSFYKTWADHPIQLGPQFDESHPIMSRPIITRVKGIIEQIKSEVTIEELLQASGSDAHSLYKALHLLAMRRMIVFSEEKRITDFENYKAWLEKIYNSIHGKNPIEVFRYFGASQNPKPSEVEKIYKDFAKSNHPDKLPESVDAEIKKMMNSVFSIVTEAHEALSDETKRKKLMDQLAQQDAQAQLKDENKLDEGIKLLRKNRPQEALKIIEAILSRQNWPEAGVYWVWAYLKSNENAGLSDSDIEKINAKMEALDRPKRQSAFYQHTVGLYKMARGNLKDSYKAFAKALEIDRSYLESRREINNLKSMIKGSSKKSATDFLNADLGKLTKSIFGKK